ncbi:hypothetical protein XM38_019200 [Halomicronema hongdechloris C2206]|uniref:Uncharacterized protein n=1 Tax=Halomicronema hongdechloris C2206 TaxID=1641165 RepID=A0A1Z3HKY7_9CYAN|nr:hypothetical protein [Halomicronema hongdechloris]ASC70971.1 hypothetical protein XM38_019200 [Halomicronema hongdechloris C2206]
MAPKAVHLRLDMETASYQHQAFLDLGLRLGRSRPEGGESRSVFEALVQFSLVSASLAPTWEQSSLFFGDLQAGDEAEVVATPSSLQFRWQGYTATSSNLPPTALQLLPGMHLDRPEAAGGYAVLTFATAAAPEAPSDDLPTPAVYPVFRLTAAFMETLLFCRWGTFLQTPATTEATRSGTRQQIYGSTAGDLTVGYTARWQLDPDAPAANPGTWQESLLLNGFLEVKNVISWPQALELSSQADANGVVMTTLTLPAIETPNGETAALNHVRHTARVLFNQHVLPPELLAAGAGELFFQLASDHSWQFLAVVEHQLINVASTSDLASHQLTGDRRWTITQEVRLVTPAGFKTFLESHRSGQTIDAVIGVDSLGDSSDSYLTASLRDQLTVGETAELDRLSEKTLLVEMSAVHWVRQPTSTSAVSAATTRGSGTTLQFLPNGTQLGLLSSPEDYGASDPHDPAWLLLTLPLLGRLQAQEADELPTTVTDALSPLQVDPILLLAQPSTTVTNLRLLSALTHWGREDAITLAVTGFDTAAGRTWARLDPLSLEESWFRLQTPPPETSPDSFQSILAALPETPARQSRAAALAHAFRVVRPTYPPQTLSISASESSGDNFLHWRPHSLLAPSGVSRLGDGLELLYRFDGSSGDQIPDDSQVDPPLNLTIDNAAATAEFLPGEAYEFAKQPLSRPRLQSISSWRPAGPATPSPWKSGFP